MVEYEITLSHLVRKFFPVLYPSPRFLQRKSSRTVGESGLDTFKTLLAYVPFVTQGWLGWLRLFKWERGSVQKGDHFVSRSPF